MKKKRALKRGLVTSHFVGSFTFFCLGEVAEKKKSPALLTRGLAQNQNTTKLLKG